MDDLEINEDQVTKENHDLYGGVLLLVLGVEENGVLALRKDA